MKSDSSDSRVEELFESNPLANDLKSTALTLNNVFSSNKKNTRIEFWEEIKVLTSNFDIEEVKLSDFNDSFGIFSPEQLIVINSGNFYLYFPYSEYHDWETLDQVTLSWDPVTSTDTGKGYLVSLNSSKNNQETLVVVNDEYVKNNPTIIILPNYIEENVKPIESNNSARIQAISTFRIKDMRIIDNFRSGIFTSAYDMQAKFLSVNYSTPTSTGVQQTLELGKVTKKEARNRTWKAVNLDAIQNWRENEVGYQFVIYHNGSGSYKLTITNNVKGNNGEWLTGSLATEITIPSKTDNTVINQTYDRSYMKILGTGGKINPTQSMYNGRAVHSFSKMEFTYEWFEN